MGDFRGRAQRLVRRAGDAEADRKLPAQATARPGALHREHEAHLLSAEKGGLRREDAVRGGEVNRGGKGRELEAPSLSSFSLSNYKYPYVITGFSGLSQILCNHREVVKNRVKILKGGSGASCCRLLYKITAVRGHVKGGGVSLHSSYPLICRQSAAQSGMRSAKNTAS